MSNMFFKKFKKPLSFVLLTIIMPLNVFAYSEYIIPGGENVGIEVKSDGILVVGVYEIDGKYPSIDAGIKTGDIITKVDGTKVTSIDELSTLLNKESAEITYKKDNKTNTVNLNLINRDGIYKTGLYVKDTITGVGTLSFIDPNTKLYGALGHEITEKTTGQIFNTDNGTIFETSVINIEKSQNGSPGEKTAKFYMENVDGKIFENTNKGIFGNYTSNFDNDKLYKVANPSDIKKGEAKILTVLNGNE